MLQTAYTKLSLKGKILLPLLLVCLGMWTVGTVSFGYFFTHRLENKLKVETEDVAAILLQAFEREKQLLFLKARWVADNRNISGAVSQGNQVKLVQYLIPLKTSFQLDWIKVVDNKRLVLAELKNQEIIQGKLKDETVTQQASIGMDLFDLVTAEGNTPPILTGITSVKSKEGILGGVIVGVAISDELLTQFRAGVQPHLVIFSDSQVTATTLPAAIKNSWQPPPIQSSPVMVKIDSESYISTSVVMAGLNNHATKLVLLNPMAPLEEDLRKLWVSIVFFCLFGAMVAIIIGTKVTDLLIRRIVNLTEATEKLAAGDWSARIEIAGNDEISVLAQGFNYMTQKVTQLLAEQEKNNEKLEQTVQERTQELQDKHQSLSQTLAKLQATQKQMIAQEKLASLGSLTAGIAHEIRNPLNFINNFAELSVELTEELLEELEAQKYTLDPEVIEELSDIVSDLSINANKINHHGKRAEKIVNNMLLHSRNGENHWEFTDINSLLAEAVSLAYHGMRAKESTFNVTFETDYDQTIGNLKIVPQDINRVFLNIVGNACYAVHKKKQEVGEYFSPVIKVKSRNLGEKIEIRIRDNGNGIKSEVIEKVFNHFFTTKPTGEGTGLGLSLSHEIITQEHQGELKVESEFGVYAEFIIVLPKGKL